MADRMEISNRKSQKSVDSPSGKNNTRSQSSGRRDEKTYDKSKHGNTHKKDYSRYNTNPRDPNRKQYPPRDPPENTRSEQKGGQGPKEQAKDSHESKGDLSQIRCYNCQGYGHLGRNCPEKHIVKGNSKSNRPPSKPGAAKSYNIEVALENENRFATLADTTEGSTDMDTYHIEVESAYCTPQMMEPQGYTIPYHQRYPKYAMEKLVDEKLRNLAPEGINWDDPADLCEVERLRN
jgi:hypothetical protein